MDYRAAATKFGTDAMDAAHGVSRGMSAGLLGGPVDILSMLLRAGGVQVPADPVGGSQWIGDKMQAAGLLRPETGSGPERVGQVASGLLATPQAVSKVASGAQSVGRQALSAVDDAMQGGGGLLGMATRPAQPMPLTAWHSSPHSFDKFDMSKVGSGEGAQAFGHGVYLAESPKVAKGYRDSTAYADVVRKIFSELPGNSSVDDVSALVANNKLSPNTSALMTALKNDDWLGFDHPSQAIRAAFKDLDKFDASPSLRQAVSAYGNTYKVDVPDSAVANMLDWDRRLMDQPYVLQKLLAAGYLPKPSMTGREFMTSQGRTPELSRGLLDVGVPGVKYLDGGSRKAGDGTRNFVVFDDKIPKIVGKE